MGMNEVLIKSNRSRGWSALRSSTMGQQELREIEMLLEQSQQELIAFTA
jgi:hypothetical protein